MAVLISEDKKDFIISCSCGCDEGMRFQICPLDDIDKDTYVCATYISGHWYTRQESSWMRAKKKIKKIWHIIQNKDYYYSEILMTKSDFNVFREYMNGM